MLIMLANQAGLAIENSHLYEKTLITAHQDSLTNLWNHGYFQYLLGVELERARATATPLSVVLLDLDDFKVYNDTLGHQAGDMLLKDIANLLRNQSRKMDYVCRYGGEEFAIILPYTDKKEAFLISERLRENIAKYPFTREESLPNKVLTAIISIPCSISAKRFKVLLKLLRVVTSIYSNVHSGTLQTGRRHKWLIMR